MPGAKMRILFLCTGNSCRSQMAEALARSIKGDAIEAYSAGTEPKGIDPRAVTVMKEIGIDMSGHRSKHVDEFAGMEFDFVITLCGGAAETCPFFPGKTKVVHRGFDDPPELAKAAASEEEALFHYRRVRDEIRSFIEQMPRSIQRDDISFKVE
ncbi:MAG: arsenate reductase ArsC [Spirochaetes bacterium]|nr:arsenate reductase ArsC [Spirochaetota bacterium]